MDARNEKKLAASGTMSGESAFPKVIKDTQFSLFLDLISGLKCRWGGCWLVGVSFFFFFFLFAFQKAVLYLAISIARIILFLELTCYLSG